MEEGKGEERLARAPDHPAAAGGGHIKRPLGTSIDRLPGEPTAELKARTSIRFPIDWRTFDQLKVFVDVDPVGKKHKIVSVEPSTRNKETIISQEVGRIADLLCAIRYFAITHFRISTDIDTRFFQLLQIGDTQCLSSTYSDLVQQKDGVRRKKPGPGSSGRISRTLPQRSPVPYTIRQTHPEDPNAHPIDGPVEGFAPPSQSSKPRRRKHCASGSRVHPEEQHHEHGAGYALSK